MKEADHQIAAQYLQAAAHQLQSQSVASAAAGGADGGGGANEVAQRVDRGRRKKKELQEVLEVRTKEERYRSSIVYVLLHLT
jgi:hypothetical protein